MTVPELGTFRAATPPIVIVTSNRTRDVHDALKRRCLYHWVEHPNFEREVEIIQLRLPHVSQSLARQVASATQQIRALGLYKPPGVAETLDWAQALTILGVEQLDVAVDGGHVGHAPPIPLRQDARVVSHGIEMILRVWRNRRRRHRLLQHDRRAPRRRVPDPDAPIGTGDQRWRGLVGFVRALRNAGLTVPLHYFEHAGARRRPALSGVTGPAVTLVHRPRDHLYDPLRPFAADWKHRAVRGLP